MGPDHLIKQWANGDQEVGCYASGLDDEAKWRFEKHGAGYNITNKVYNGRMAVFTNDWWGDGWEPTTGGGCRTRSGSSLTWGRGRSGSPMWARALSWPTGEETVGIAEGTMARKLMTKYGNL